MRRFLVALAVAVLAVLALPTLAGADHRRAARPPGTVFHEYDVPGLTAINGLTTSPDGALWFTGEHATQGHVVGRLVAFGTPTLTVVNREVTGITFANGVAWCAAGDALLRVDTSGEITTILVRVGAHIENITSDHEGVIWFTEPYANRLGRVAPATGNVMEIELRASLREPSQLTVAPDDTIWFIFRNQVAHLSHDGEITVYANDSFWIAPTEFVYYGFTSIAAAPDGSIWVAATSSLGPIFVSAPKGSFVARILPSGEFSKIVTRLGFTTYDVAVRHQFVWLADCLCAPYTLESSELIAFTPNATVEQTIAVPLTGHFPESVINRFVSSPDGTFWITLRDRAVIVNVTYF